MATPMPEQRPALTLVPSIQSAPVFKDEPAARKPVVSVQKVAAHTNRIASLALLPHTARGYRQLGKQWLDRYHNHFPQLIADADRAVIDNAGDLNQAAQYKNKADTLRAEYREHRKAFLTKTGIAAGTVTGGVTIGAATGSLWLDIAALVGAWGIGAWKGRNRTQPNPDDAIGLPDDDTTRPRDSYTLADIPEGASPFPIRRAETPQQAALCVLLAMVAENVPVAEVWDIQRQPWGWQCKVRVSDGTPEAIIAKAGGLETRFDLPANGVRPQPMVERRACAILRLVSGNPFATAPGLPYRAPKSISITDKSRLGTSVGGDPLQAAFAGVMGLVVAASGGGKTGMLQAIGEVTTACYDNITIDLDPHGDGLEDLYDAVRITGRGHQQIEAVLLFLLMLSKGRARLRTKLGMGKKWQISREHPHITVIFDEFPKASDLAKRLAFELLLVGRKEAVTLLIASQGGTKLYLGENIAQMIAFKAVGPSKVGDTRAVFGDDAVREGWLPHKLSPATDTDPKDAGHVFVQGVPGMPDEPIEYAIHHIPSDRLKKLAAERHGDGLIDPDQDSLKAMTEVDLPDIDGLPKLLTWEQLCRLCDAELPAGATVDGPARQVIEDAVAVMEKKQLDRMKTEVLLLALRDYDDSYTEWSTDQLKAAMKEAGAGSPETLGRIGEEQNPRGYKLAKLTNLL